MIKPINRLFTPSRLCVNLLLVSIILCCRTHAADIFNPHLPFYADAATFERYPKDKVKLPPMPLDDMEDVGQVGIRMSDKEAFVYDQTTAADPNSPQSLHRMVQCYQAAADYADQMVGRLLDKLESTGRIDDTMIVLWSDHGYHLGDKQCCVKFTLWEKANHIPFIIVAPGVAKPGSVCSSPVSLARHQTIDDDAWRNRPQG